jgi:hypothetical protein
VDGFGLRRVVLGALLCHASLASAQAELLGPRPKLVGPLAALVQRTPIWQARKAAPAFFTANDDTPKDVISPDFRGLKFSVSIEQSPTRGMTVGDWLILLPKANGISTLTRAWGQPVVTHSRLRGRVLSWWNTTERLRARVEERDATGDEVTVTLTRYTPLDELLGSGPFFGFEKGRSFLGRKGYEILRERPEWKCNFSGNCFDLPPTEYDDSQTMVELEADDNQTVTAFKLILYYGDERSHREMLAALGRRFGKSERKVSWREVENDRALELRVGAGKP